MNRLYYGDNLDVLREHIPDGSVDLVYLDPPFNSNRSYNVLFRETNGTAADSQITAFDDTWHWTQAAEATLREIETTAPPHVVEMMHAIVGFVGRNDVTAYLVMMTVRLIELHRVLKDTGSIYLHCDPTASHYLKVVMDTVFGTVAFGSEITWQRTATHNDAKRWASLTDCILFYVKGTDFTWHPQYRPQSSEAIQKRYRFVDSDGRRYRLGPIDSPNPRPNMMYVWRGYQPPTKGWRYSQETMAKLDEAGLIWYPTDKRRRPARKLYLDESKGALLGNVWTDIPPLQASAKERLGYPTQKPLALLERIIQASSNPGDLVLDPFCGCGTTIVAAQKLGRRWIGIDITHLAVSLMRSRLEGMFGDAVEYEVVGVPADAASARALAEQDRYEFQHWALGLLNAQPVQQKRGADQGIDGCLFFRDEADRRAKKAVIQVKSGHVQSSVIRDLGHVMTREKAAMAFLITLERPTQPMLTEALSAGYYHSPGWNRDYPRIQIRTVEQLLAGEGFEYPPTNVSLSQAERVKGEGPEQGRLV